jgi:hypothetical protein
MGVPRSNTSPAERLKALEQEIGRLRSYLAVSGVDATISTPASAVTITSATWVEAFTVAGPRLATNWVIHFNAICAVGTAGQVRAVIAGTSTILFGPVDVGDGVTLPAAWTLDPPGNFDDYTVVEIQAQRVTGSGSFTVRPYSAAGG